MWPSRRSLRGYVVTFRIKMASAVKRSRTVALSAERVLESLKQKGDGNDGMWGGEKKRSISSAARYKRHIIQIKV